MGPHERTAGAAERVRLTVQLHGLDAVIRDLRIDPPGTPLMPDCGCRVGTICNSIICPNRAVAG